MSPSRWMARLTLAAALAVAGCTGADTPQDIDTATDVCSRCRMSIGQLAHAGEMITADRRVRKYDSLGCLALDHHAEVEAGRPPRGAWVLDYRTQRWLEADEAYYALARMATDHMGYGIASTASREAALELTGSDERKVVRWPALHAAVVAAEARHDE